MSPDFTEYLPRLSPGLSVGRRAGATNTAQAGFVLLTSLILLFTLTLVGIVAMNSTTLEYRLSTNAVYVSRARESSEAGRMAVASVMPQHVYERSWSGIRLPGGLTMGDGADSGSEPDDRYGGNDAGESFELNAPENLNTDAFYRVSVDANGDNDSVDAVDQFQADIKIYQTATKLDQGSGTAMVAGYEGLGKGAAAGGMVLYYFVASEGKAPGNTRYWTSSDVRARVLN